MATIKHRRKSNPPAGHSSAQADEPRYVGVDLHKQIAVFHVLDARGKSIQQGQFAVTADSIAQFAKEHLNIRCCVAVEATSNTWAFVRLIRDHVAQVVVSNPMKTKAIAEANIKTDKVDALVLAQLLRCDYLPSVWVPTSDIEDKRALAARRTALVNHRTAIRNRIHSVLARRLIVRARPAGLFTRQAGSPGSSESTSIRSTGPLIDSRPRPARGASGGRSMAIEHMIDQGCL